MFSILVKPVEAGDLCGVHSSLNRVSRFAQGVSEASIFSVMLLQTSGLLVQAVKRKYQLCVISVFL